MKQEFRTHTNNNAKIAVYGGMIILLASTIVPLFFAPLTEFKWHWSFLILGVFVGFFYYVILSSFLKFFIRFTVSEDGLLIQKPFFHRRFIPFSEIEQVKLLDQQETYDFFLSEVRAQYGLKDDSDISTFIYKLRKESSYYKYLTITPRGSSTGTGKAEQLRSLHIEAEMLALQFKNGKFLFLAPQRITEFHALMINGLSSKGRNIIQSDLNTEMTNEQR